VPQDRQREAAAHAPYERGLERVLWRCRTLSNTALEQRITAWQRCHVSLTRYQQEAELKALRAELPEDAAIHSHPQPSTAIHSHVLQDVLPRLNTTYQAFFRRLASGEQRGFSRFQGSNRSHSFTDKEYGNGARLDNGALVLSKIGRIAVRWSRMVEGSIKTVTISREADGWYVCFSCAEVPIEPLPRTGKETGIDVGLKVFLITADGQPVENPRPYRTAERNLRKAQQRVSRRQKGSHRRRTAVRVLAKRHQHVRCLRCLRSDFHHKTALDLVRAYDTIDVEAIQPANLSRRPAPKPDGTGGSAHNGASRKAGLNSSIQDAGWRRVLSILTFKAACAGKRMEAVPPAYTSQDCSGCGERIYTSLSVRTDVCTHCGLIVDRDENAAKTIQWRGQRLRGLPAVAGELGGWWGDEPRTRRPVGRAECQEGRTCREGVLSCGADERWRERRSGI
jgi:putative transposase